LLEIEQLKAEHKNFEENLLAVSIDEKKILEKEVKEKVEKQLTEFYEIEKKNQKEIEYKKISRRKCEINRKIQKSSSRTKK